MKHIQFFLITGACLWCLFFWSGCQGVYFKGGTGDKVVALTWDDGPDPTYTPLVLKMLHTYRVKATFFMIGRLAQARPDLVRRVRDAGHEIGNHSQNHLFYLSWLPRDHIRKEIEVTQVILKGITGEAPAYFRAPLGWVSTELISVCREMNLPIINGSVKARDVSQPGTGSIVQAVLDQVEDGAIIILHDGGGVGPYRDRTQTLEALPIIIEKLRNQGYRFVLLRELASFPVSGL